MKQNQSQALVKISKKLSWALRHGINTLGLTITSAGYVKLKDLLLLPQFSKVSLQVIESIIASDSKSRFNIMTENEELYIRANQGHTIKEVKDDDLLTPIENPLDYPIVVHGTTKAAWKLIKNRGLYKMDRNHIHFARDLPGSNQVISGARNNSQVFIFVDIAKAMADGMKFFISQNFVILSSGFLGLISPKYFKSVIIDKVPVEFNYSPIAFDYFLVLDFEANCIENGSLPCQEIIEFPVKVLNAATLAVDYVFHHYVKPEVVPILSEFCKNLTGITQEMVSEQETIAQILDRFHNFLEQHNILSSNWIFVTCGDWDLKTCLTRECQFKNINRKDYFNTWINIKFLIPSFKGGMMELLKLLEVPHSGRHHSGIDDVTNITECLVKLLDSKIVFSNQDIRSNQVKKN